MTSTDEQATSRTHHGLAVLRIVAPGLLITPGLRWLIAHHAVEYATPPRTRCEHCQQLTWPTGCGPRARCPACGHHLGAPPYLVETAGVVIAAGLIVAGYRGFALAAYSWWAAGLLVLAVTDTVVHRLPYRLTIATTAGALALLAASPTAARTWFAGLLGVAVAVVFYAVARWLNPAGLGPGDVAMAVPIGLVVGRHGLTALLATLALAQASAVLTIAIRRLGHRPPGALPFGPHLAAAAITVALALGPE